MVFLFKHSGIHQVREAMPADDEAVQRELLERARRVFLRIPPDDVLRRLGMGLSWLTETDDRLSGLMQIEVQPFGVALIVAVALADGWQVVPFLDACLPQAQATARQKGASTLVQIGYAPWLTGILKDQGFIERDGIITYEWRFQPLAVQGNKEVIIRPAHLRDLQTLVALDEQIFGPIWHKPANSITTALAEASLFTVAQDSNGQIIGYQWCNVKGGHGHLTRLAVRPGWESKGIGTRLLTEALRAMVEEGVNWVTLNTQESNTRSQILYERHGFRAIGERVPVLRKDL